MKAPLQVHPKNPRYFTDDGKRAIYVTGSHTWSNLQDMGISDPPARLTSTLIYASSRDTTTTSFDYGGGKCQNGDSADNGIASASHTPGRERDRAQHETGSRSLT